MIKVIKIGTEARIDAFKKDAVALGLNVNGFFIHNFHDPTSIYFFYEPYIQWEERKLTEAGMKIKQFINSEIVIAEYHD